MQTITWQYRTFLAYDLGEQGAGNRHGDRSHRERQRFVDGDDVVIIVIHVVIIVVHVVIIVVHVGIIVVHVGIIVVHVGIIVVHVGIIVVHVGIIVVHVVIIVSIRSNV